MTGRNPRQVWEAIAANKERIATEVEQGRRQVPWAKWTKAGTALRWAKLLRLEAARTRAAITYPS
jgi:hypothetical protein